MSKRNYLFLAALFAVFIVLAIHLINRPTAIQPAPDTAETSSQEDLGEDVDEDLGPRTVLEKNIDACTRGGDAKVVVFYDATAWTLTPICYDTPCDELLRFSGLKFKRKDPRSDWVVLAINEFTRRDCKRSTDEEYAKIQGASLLELNARACEQKEVDTEDVQRTVHFKDRHGNDKSADAICDDTPCWKLKQTYNWPLHSSLRSFAHAEYLRRRCEQQEYEMHEDANTVACNSGAEYFMYHNHKGELNRYVTPICDDTSCGVLLALTEPSEASIPRFTYKTAKREYARRDCATKLEALYRTRRAEACAQAKDYVTLDGSAIMESPTPGTNRYNAVCETTPCDELRRTSQPHYDHPFVTVMAAEEYERRNCAKKEQDQWEEARTGMETINVSACANDKDHRYLGGYQDLPGSVWCGSHTQAVCEDSTCVHLRDIASRADSPLQRGLDGYECEDLLAQRAQELYESKQCATEEQNLFELLNTNSCARGEKMVNFPIHPTNRGARAVCEDTPCSILASLLERIQDAPMRYSPMASLLQSEYDRRKCAEVGDRELTESLLTRNRKACEEGEETFTFDKDPDHATGPRSFKPVCDIMTCDKLRRRTGERGFGWVRDTLKTFARQEYERRGCTQSERDTIIALNAEACKPEGSRALVGYDRFDDDWPATAACDDTPCRELLILHPDKPHPTNPYRWLIESERARRGCDE